MKDYLCRCNNCYAILLDENPQTYANKFSVPDCALEMELCHDGIVFWGCPNCHTDDYLIDIETEEMLEETLMVLKKK